MLHRRYLVMILCKTDYFLSIQNKLKKFLECWARNGGNTKSEYPTKTNSTKPVEFIYSIEYDKSA
jgi:hypothetical protein